MVEMRDTHIVFRGSLADLANRFDVELTTVEEELGEAAFLRLHGPYGAEYELFAYSDDTRNWDAIQVFSSQPDDVEALASILRRAAVKPADVETFVDGTGAPVGQLAKIQKALANRNVKNTPLIKKGVSNPASALTVRSGVKPATQNRNRTARKDQA